MNRIYYDVIIPIWTNGMDTAMDVTAATPRYALTTRFGEKMTRHGEDCRRAGLVFVPLVVETLGGWEEQAEVQIK